MKRNIVESVLGAFVLVVAVGFFVWAYARADVGTAAGGYTIVAKFDRADGLEVGGPVRISGIRVGQIVSQRLDPVTYRAEVRFSVDNAVELPADSSAAILSASLLGGKYLALVPGGDDRMLGDGDEISYTQSAINFEDLIGQFIFSQGGGGGAGTGPGGGGGGDGDDAGDIFN